MAMKSNRRKRVRLICIVKFGMNPHTITTHNSQSLKNVTNLHFNYPVVWSITISKSEKKKKERKTKQSYQMLWAIHFFFCSRNEPQFFYMIHRYFSLSRFISKAPYEARATTTTAATTQASANRLWCFNALGGHIIISEHWLVYKFGMLFECCHVYAIGCSRASVRKHEWIGLYTAKYTRAYVFWRKNKKNGENV